MYSTNFLHNYVIAGDKVMRCSYNHIFYSLQYASAFGSGGDLSEDEVVDLPSCVYASRSSHGALSQQAAYLASLHHTHSHPGTIETSLKEIIYVYKYFS